MLPPQAAVLVQRFWHLPVDAAAHGPALDRHLLLNLWIFLALLVLAHILLWVGLAKRRAHTPPRRQALIEFLPLAALALLFVFLAARAEALWQTARYTGADPAALQVEVTGMQFAWYFRYPGADATFGVTKPELVAPGEGNPLGLDSTDAHGVDDFVSSQLVLPAGRQVDLRLRSQDVIHGFSVPEMRLKQNAVPGQTIHIHFTPTTPGTYAILCTQLCGLGHYRMAATLRVVREADFEDWLAQHKAGAAR
ncbi:MAG: cupredoxin domain-containing protein [Acidobacteriaceae bacterium]